MADQVVLPVVGGFVGKPEQWVRHYRARNYIARIVGFDERFTFKREFLKLVRVGGKTFFKKEDFAVGELYEIRCVYYTSRSHRPEPVLTDLFLCTAVADDRVVLERVPAEEAIRIIERREREGAAASRVDAVGKF